jgi:hypothetical protein
LKKGIKRKRGSKRRSMGEYEGGYRVGGIWEVKG